MSDSFAPRLPSSTARPSIGSIRSRLGEARSFSEFNREERNAVATLYGALLLPGNLRRFATAVEWDGLGDPERAEVFVEWTYLRDMWDSHRSNDEKREVILDLLAPSNRTHLESCSIREFNEFFGAGPRPSTVAIQTPGRWSLRRYSANVADDQEFLRICRFKWAFNIKPDLVVHGDGDNVLCIEAKWESPEGFYPSSDAERALFVQRGLALVRQTDIQRQLVEGMLGFRGTFRYLARRANCVSSTCPTITWSRVLAALDLSTMPRFLRHWADAVQVS